MQPYPPLGTLYAAALLRQRGFSVALFDSMLEDPEKGFPEAFARTRPKLVVIYEDNFNFLSKMCLSRMRQIAFGMIDMARAAGRKVVVNGSDPSDHSGEYLQRGADYVLLGEAEWTLLELVQSVIGESGRPVEEICGLCYFDRKSNSPTRTSPRPLMRNLDLLPTPSRELVDIERYRGVWKKAHGMFSLNLIASRGCPYRCNWCAKPIFGDTYSSRPPAEVAEEMSELRSRYGAEHLWFADDIFAINPHWVRQFAAEVERRGCVLPYKVQARADRLTA